MCRWHTLDNVQHNSRGTQRFQSCGHYNMPDMLTVGQGAQTREEYRSQMALFAAMGSPLIIVTRTRTAGRRRSDGLRSLRVSCAQGTVESLRDEDHNCADEVRPPWLPLRSRAGR